MGTKTASNVLTITTVEDGVSAPYIHEYYYKWTNSYTSYGSDTGWSKTQPARPDASYYLWRKDIYKEYNPATNAYDLNIQTSFLCQNGENGTGFQPKGSAVDVPKSSTSGVAVGDNGTFLMTTSSPYLYKSNGTSWVAQSTPALSDSYIVNKTGDAKDGHAYSWTGSNWLDIGMVRGASGTSNYIHVAWCNVKGDGTDWSTQSTDFTTDKLANVDYKFMGTLVNNDGGVDPDVHHAGEYEWNEIKGNDAYIVSANPSVIAINTNESGVPTDTTQKSIVVNVYKGDSQNPLSTTITNATLPSGFVQDSSTGNTLTFHATTNASLATPKNITITVSAGDVTRSIVIEVVGSKAGGKGDNGDNAIQLTLDNEHEDFIYSAGEKVAPSSITTQAHLYDGNTEVAASNITWSVNQSKCAGIDFTKLTIGAGLFTITGITSDAAKLCIQATYPKTGGQNYEAMFTMNRTSQDKYDLFVSPKSIAYNPSTYTTQTVNVTAKKTDLRGVQSSAYISLAEPLASGVLALFYAWVNADGTRTQLTRSNQVNIPITAAYCAAYVGLHLELRLYKSASEYDTKDFETIEFAKSQNGQTGGKGDNAIQLDLTNQNDALQYMGDENLTGSVTSQAILYDGGLPATSGVAFSIGSGSTIPVNYYTLNAQTGAITVTGLPSGLLRGVLIVTATYQEQTYSKEFSVQRLDNGQPKFELVIDKPAVVQNISVTTTPVPINIKVFKTYIDTSVNRLVRVQLTSLTADALRVYSVTTAGASNMTRNYGASGVTYNASPSLWTGDVTFHVTNDEDWGSSSLVSYDYETIPITAVRRGQMGRNIYLAGTLGEVGGTSFDVTDTSAPYVQVGLDTNNMPKCYVFDGANGNNYQFPSDESGYQDDPNWELMVSDFKYLMTKAIFSNFAKLGSGIFNGDYAFSQYGTRLDGTIDTNYQNFMPVNSTEYTVNSTSLVLLGTFSGVAGRKYYFRFKTSAIDGNVYFYVNTSQTLGGYVWHDAYSDVIDRSIVASGNNTYYVMARLNTDGDARRVSVEIKDDTTFKPNLYIDWLKGEIYAQLGRFVNVTIEGVMNNLIQTIDSTNYSQYGESNGSVFWLNPAKVGTIIRYRYSSAIGLPSAFVIRNVDGTNLCDTTDGTHQMTLDELRQCVGKRIYVLTDGNTGMASIKCGRYESATTTEYKMLRVVSNATWYYSYTSNTTLSNWFWIFECKMGKYPSGSSVNENYECIYWELQAAFNKLPDQLAW